MKITKNILLAAILLAFVASSCQQKTGKQQDQKTVAMDSDEFREKLLSINPGLKDPSGMMIVLEMAGADYIDGLVLPHENVDFYTQRPGLAALNLGVYTVDIAYLVAYGKKEQALVKYERARKLANSIGLTNQYEDAIFERYRDQSADEEALLQALTMTANNVQEEMSEGEYARHVTLFVTGEFIEKMFIATQVIRRYPDDLPPDARMQILRQLMIIIAEQEKPLDDLIGLLDQIRDEGEGERFMAEMNQLNSIYEAADFKTFISEYKPGDEYTGDRDYLNEITNQVERLANYITSTSPIPEE